MKTLKNQLVLIAIFVTLVGAYSQENKSNQ